MQTSLKGLHKSPRLQWRILNAGLYRAAQGVDMPLHQHTYWELVYYQAGTVDCLVESTSRPGHVGLYWLTPPGINHGEKAVTAYACYWIALQGTAPEAGERPTFLDDDLNRVMGNLCQQITAEWGGASAGRERMLALLGEQMGLLLERAKAERIMAPAKQAVLRAERCLEERCSQPVTLREVAREVGVSPSALRKYFHGVRGFSPRTHLHRMRCERAVRFLRTSSLKLETIAELCGYDSASHLSRCVKALTRRTPGQIRAE
jgi:AraC-like DNA-binding protein/quercetin dioxygenase-like cupin family protein